MAAADPLGTRRYQKIAEAVRRADRYRCRICGLPGRTVDHIIPRHLGGRVFDRGNMRTLCALCNEIKGGSLMSDAEVLVARRARGGLPPAIVVPSNVVTSDYSKDGDGNGPG